MKNILKLALLCGAAIHAAPTLAHDVYADDHAPIGVMADHAHKKGEVMFSARYMRMEMSENQIGTDLVSNETIVTTIPNRFFGLPGQPPTLRVVPESMSTDMYMVGAMYAPEDWITLVAMSSYIEKEMLHTVFAGPVGTDVRGQFTTNPKDIGDLTVGAIFPVLGVSDHKQSNRHELNVRAAVSLPLGPTDETDTILTPMGTTPTVRIPYPMQIGSGTFDLKPAVTYKRWSGGFGFGAQYSGIIRTGENEQGYRFGDVHQFTAWASYRPAQWVSLSGRVQGRTTGQIEGIDPIVVAPIQTANPDFQGGERVDLIAGVNFVSTHGALAGHRLGIEFGAPVYQDLNGPQLAGDWMLTIGWQKAF
ncbi:MAG: transporter [Pseudomonadota bacterium]